MRISRAMKRTLSGSKLSKRTFLSATILPLSESRALYTLLYVPWPIWERGKKDAIFHLGVRAAWITKLGRRRGRRKGRTLSIFSKESARRGVQPLMASPATAESQAGQPAATCSPRALLAKLPPRRTSACAAAAAERDDRDRRSLFTCAGFSGFWSACCSGAAPASAGAAAASEESTPSCCG